MEAVPVLLIQVTRGRQMPATCTSIGLLAAFCMANAYLPRKIHFHSGMLRQYCAMHNKVKLSVFPWTGFLLQLHTHLQAISMLPQPSYCHVDLGQACTK
ncbi:hypothetical protein [Aquitalea sp.]|uniref:hypothetical protein n=1 Tax=Aquitalea sp. TaxID=1872623 RepID=UPI00258881AB|nr:hypothetical protein [Aquitalea sp.]